MRAMSFPRPRARALCAAVLYVGTVAVVGVLRDGSAGPYALAFPGFALLVVVLYVLSAALDPGEPPADSASALGPLPHLVGGALLNVLLVWAAVGFARLFVRDCRAARRARRARGGERLNDGAAAPWAGPGRRGPGGPHRVDLGS
jgi:hypothetical protein